MADREHSIQEQMLPLQDNLLKWRRLEIFCWAKLLDRVEEDSKQLTILSGWPLIKAAVDFSDNSEIEQFTGETKVKI